jgi:5-formyltetrahydrofolate cyclo-ligase
MTATTPCDTLFTAAARRAKTAAIFASSFDTSAFDADRLAKDAVARDEAAAAMAAQPGAWKWAVRKKIWDTLEATDEADFPRPVHHRIPNFKQAERAAERLAALPEFVSADCVKVNPDTPQRAVRFAALQAGKTLLTPQPRLRTGFFNRFSARDCPPGVEALREASTSAGASNKHAIAIVPESSRRCRQVRQADRRPRDGRCC